MIAATFTAWQTIGVQVDKPPTWDKYLRSMGLSDKPNATKEDLEREAAVSMDNVKRIMEKARNGSRKGTI